jgi:hypothetical protein
MTLDLALLITSIQLSKQIRREVDPTYAGDRGVFTWDGSSVVTEHEKLFPASRKRVALMVAVAGVLLLPLLAAFTIR